MILLKPTNFVFIILHTKNIPLLLFKVFPLAFTLSLLVLYIPLSCRQVFKNGALLTVLEERSGTGVLLADTSCDKSPFTLPQSILEKFHIGITGTAELVLAMLGNPADY